MKVVILAAGEGKRMRPLTLTRSKHMIPLANRPILEHMISSLRECGFEEALIVVGYKKEQIMEYFGDGSRFGISLTYLTQKRLAGTADAIRIARDYVEDDVFLTVCGDVLASPDVIRLVVSSYVAEDSAVMGTVPVSQPERYGIVKLRGEEVIDIVEKPTMEEAPSNLANASIYVFSNDIFEAIERTRISPRGELEITDSIRHLVRLGRSVKAVRIPSEGWMDIGLPWDLLKANEIILEKEDLKVRGGVEDGARLIGSVGLSEEGRIRSGAYVEGPVLIGDSDIGPNCYIRPYTSIGGGVRIGNACEIKNSIIMDDTHIAHLSYVADSIIGSNCNLGAGCITANLRFDEKTIKASVRGKQVDTGLRKLGAIVGDNVKIGVGALLMPGVKVGSSSWIGPDVTVYRDVPPNTIVILRQELERKPRARGNLKRERDISSTYD